METFFYNDFSFDQSDEFEWQKPETLATRDFSRLESAAEGKDGCLGSDQS